MLIITADDYGKSEVATDNILGCYLGRRITSASAMVYMRDSERAAQLANGCSLEIGLHLNFTLPFDGRNVPSKLRENQNKVVWYLQKHKLSQAVYNPFLSDSFEYSYRSQQEEFTLLYGKPPDYYNGHHHMHLCANILASKMIPEKARVRRAFTLDWGEKKPLNRVYWRLLDMVVSRRFISTDCFFSITPVENRERLQNIFQRAAKNTIEIEVHPENREEHDFLLSDRYQHLINSVQKGSFRQLDKRRLIHE